MPTLADVQRFLAHTDAKYFPLFLTVLLTGIRRGEVLGLQWGDVDWKRSLIWIRRSLCRDFDGKLTLLVPKSKGSPRAIGMPPSLAVVLHEHSLREPGTETELVFRTKKHTPIDPDNLYKREFLGAIGRAGVPAFRLHDLRHLYGSVLREEGEDIKLVQEQMGHASIQTTLDIYGHIVRDTRKEVSTRLEATLLGPLLDSLTGEARVVTTGTGSRPN